MCTGAEAMIISAATSGAQMGMGMSATESNARMAQIRSDMLTDSAKEDLKLNTKISLRKAEEQERAYVQEQVDSKIAAMELKSSANVASGESGVTGQSVEDVVNDVERQRGQIDLRNKITYKNNIESIRNTHTQNIHKMISAINGIPAVPTPDYLTPFVSAVSSFSTPDNIKALKGS